MSRFAVYFLVALVTFGVSSFVVFTFYFENKNISEIKEEKFIIPKISAPKTIQSFSNNKIEQFAPTYIQEKTEQEIPFCRNKKILPIWKEVIKTENFREWLSTPYESKDCNDLLDIKEFDLNNDGQKEILVRGKNSLNLCGGVGNCVFWVFAKNGNKYKTLLFSTDYADITDLPNQVKKTKTNGYFDIVLKGHMTARDTTYNFYKFDSKKYKEGKCLVDTFIEYKDDKPIYGFMSCKKFFKRWENEY